MSVDWRGGWFRDVRLDVAGAVLGLALAIAMLPLRLVASQVFIETLPLALGTACVLYLLAVRNEGTTGSTTLHSTTARLLPSVVVLGMAGMVLLTTITGRSAAFFALSATVGTLVFTQVLLVAEEDFHRDRLLVQVVLFGLLLRFAGLYSSPGFIGIDVWTHVPNWSERIVESASLSPIADEKYFASPLFHLLVVSASVLFDVSLRDATHLSVGLAMPLSAVLVYSTARHFTHPRWAVLATALFTVSGSVIEWGLALIPTSLGLVFFLAILFSLSRILFADYGTNDFLLVVFFSVAVILTHQISSFIMLVFVGASLLAKLLLQMEFLRTGSQSASGFGSQDTANVAGLLVFDLGLITFMWSLTPFHGSSFLETTFNFFYDTLVTSGGFLNLASSGDAEGGATATGQPTVLEQVVRYTDEFAFLLLLTLAILGSLYLLRRRNVSHAGFTTILTVVVMLAFVFGFPLFGIRTFVPGRWFAFLAAPMAVLAAVGLGYASVEFPPRLALAVLLVVALAFPAFAITTGDAALDDPVVEGTQTRYSYTQPELAAVDTIGTIYTDEDVEVHTDHPYATVFGRTEAHDASVVTLDDDNATNATVVYRDYQRSGATYFVDENGTPHQSSVSEHDLCGDRDVTYDNGAVRLCVEPR